MTQGIALILESETKESRCADCKWSSRGLTYSHEHPMPGSDKPVQHTHGPGEAVLEAFQPWVGESPDPNEHANRAGHTVFQRTVTIMRIEPVKDE